jgi:tetratricopeptide (TPR) repeat protein
MTNTTIKRSYERATQIVALSAACIVLITGCNRPSPVKEAFIAPTESGLSPATLSGIILTQRRLEAKEDDTEILFQLTHQYLQAVRETSDSAYYARIEKLLEHAEHADSNNPEIPFMRGSIALGRHDFKTALNYGKQVTASHPQTARYRGLLADAQVELGQYEDAIASLQKMSDINPDYNALTRIAYVREIHGDVPGAIEAMEEAILAGVSVPENLAWALTELGRLHLQSNPATASAHYEAALKTYPDFAPAVAGLAKVAMAQDDPAKAKIHAERAMELMPLPEYAALLGDIYLKENNPQKAAVQFTIVKAGYQLIASGGTNVELERITFLVDHDMDLDSIVEQARAVYAERPTIYAADLLAWALYKTGQHEESQEFSEKALATGSRDPAILLHAKAILEEN